MTSRRLSQAACLAWAAVVVGFYYRGVWRLALAGPASWDLPALRHTAVPPLLIIATVVALLAVSGWWRVRAGRWRTWSALGWVLLLLVLGGAFWPHRLGPDLLPWGTEAAWRALSSLAAAGLVVFDAHVAGGVVLRLARWRSRVAVEAFLFRVALGFGVISYLSLAAAYAEEYRPPVVAGGLIIIAVAGAAPRLLRWTALLRRGALHARPAGVVGEQPDRRQHPGQHLLWMAVCASAVAIALVGALAPEVEYDALWYHLALPAIWLHHGAPTDVPAEYVALYPLTWELVFGAGLSVAGPVAAKLLHFICLPLCGLAVWQSSRRFFPDSPRWLAAALFVTTPTILWEATTAYIDLALAFYVTLGLYAFLAYRDAGESGDARPWLTLTAACLGMAVVIKHLGLIVLAAVVLALVLERVAARPKPRPARLSGAAVLIAVALLMAAPWYLRAWSATGNPFFPEMYKAFGAATPRWDAASEQALDRFKAHFGMPRSAGNLLALPWNITMHDAAFAGCLGPLFLVALPALILLGRREPRARDATRVMAIVVVTYVAVWASPISSFQLRFLVPIVPALAVLAAIGLGSLFATVASRGARVVAAAAIAGLLVANLPPFVSLHEGDRADGRGWLTHVVREVPLRVVIGRESADEFLHERVPTYSAWRYAAAHLPEAARVLEFGGGDNYYATRDRLSMDARAVRGAWAAGAGTDSQVRATLDRNNISHVLIERRLVPELRKQHVTLISPAFRAAAFELEYEDNGALLYRYSR